MSNEHENAVWLNRYEKYITKGKKSKDPTTKPAVRSVDKFLETYKKSLRKFKADDALSFHNSILIFDKDGICISKGNIERICKNIKDFFYWLIDQPGMKTKINKSDIEYFTLSSKVLAEIKSSPKLEYPDFEYILELIRSISINNDVDLRDRAFIAFTFLTGSRISAARTTRLGLLNLEKNYVEQSPKKGTETKFSKQLILKIHEIHPELTEALKSWVLRLYELGFSDDDPLFPILKMNKGKYLTFQKSTEFEKKFYRSKTTIGVILKSRCGNAGLTYRTSNDLRHCLWKLIQESSKGNVDELIALSLLFGHDFLKTSVQSYGRMSYDEALDKVNNFKINTKKNKNE